MVISNRPRPVSKAPRQAGALAKSMSSNPGNALAIATISASSRSGLRSHHGRDRHLVGWLAAMVGVPQQLGDGTVLGATITIGGRYDGGAGNDPTLDRDEARHRDAIGGSPVAPLEGRSICQLYSTL